MKVLQINNVYDFGSTGKITKDIHLGLQEKGIESVVYYGRRNKTQDYGVHKICSEIYAKANNGISRISGLMYGGCSISTSRLLNAIDREKPDVVHLQCLNGYFVNIYRLIEYLKNAQIPTVLTLHAEFMHTANCGHALDCEKWKSGCGNCPRLRRETKSLIFDRTAESWKRMKTAFDGFDNLVIVSVSPWLMERAKQSPILQDKRHCVIYNGVNTEIFHPYYPSVIRDELGIGKDEKVVFHATPYFSLAPDSLKGGCFVKLVAERMPGTRIVVAGPYDHSCEYPNNMLMLGSIDNQEYLAQLYSMADVTLLTSKRETFSMICAESFCCGTPVVGFKAGAPEMISLNQHSDYVEYGNVEDLCRHIELRLHSTYDRSVIAAEGKSAYAKERMILLYLEQYYGWRNECEKHRA